MLDQKLEDYGKESVYPFHMPGHKRIGFPFPNPYTIDITEIHDFDNLHHPQGEIKQLMEEYASIYHSGKTYLLVNGATAGNLSAIFAACQRGDEIAVGRNSHKSVYHGIYIRELTAHYLYPEILDYGIPGAISPYDVAQILQEKPNIKALLLTSPTYEGINSNLKEIVTIAHRHQVPVIVDSAHGAHLGITEAFPNGAVESGADLVITSIHKTLPSFTQTALLHYNNESLIPQRKVEMYLQIFQTSSPSYLLMSGMSKCCRYLKEHKEDFISYRKRLEDFYQDTKILSRLHIYRRDDMDLSKIVIGIDKGIKGFTGENLSEILREGYGLEMEMASFSYVLAMTSVMDTQEGFSRLCHALHEIDHMLAEEQDTKNTEQDLLDIFQTPEKLYQPGEKQMELYEAKDCPGSVCELKDAAGKIAAEEICLYPPGIPLVVPGEIITEEHVKQIQRASTAGLNITGLSQNPPGVMIVN